jgi:hypothetical protein
MTTEETLDLALEYLKLQKRYGPAIAYGNTTIDECIAAIKKVRVAEFVADFTEQPAPVQKPVWIQPDHLQKAQKAPFLCRVEPHKRDDFVPLYTTPPAAQPAPVSLNRDGIKKLLEQSGFDKATPEERAAFISGIRHRESEILDTQPAQPAVPDAFGTREGEHPQYIQGWNDCRAEMLSMRKRVKP